MPAATINLSKEPPNAVAILPGGPPPIRENQNSLVRLVQRICSIVREFFAALYERLMKYFGWNKNAIDPELNQTFATLLTDKDKEWSGLHPPSIRSVPQSPQKVVVYPSTQSLSSPLKCIDAPTIDREHLYEGLQGAHLAARRLVGDVVEVSTERFMEEQIIPNIPVITEGGQKIKGKLSSVALWLKQIKNKTLSDTVPPSFPKNCTMKEKNEHFIILYDLFDLYCIGRFISQQGAIEDKRKILENFIYGGDENAAAKDRKPQLSWLPQSAYVYIEPFLDWFTENIEKDPNVVVLSDFEEFLRGEKYKDIHQKYVTDQPTVLADFLGLIYEKLFGSMHDSVNNHVQGLDELLAPGQLESATRELIEENTHFITGVITDRLMTLLKQVEFSNLIHQMLPDLKKQMTSDFVEEVSDEGNKILSTHLVDILFPLMETSQEGEVRMLSLLWDKIHVPKSIDTVLKSFPGIESIVKQLARLKPDEPLPLLMQSSLKRLKSSMQRRIMFLAQMQLNVLAAEMLKQIIDTVSDPNYISQLMVESILPNTLDKVITAMVQEILYHDIEKDQEHNFVKSFLELIKEPSKEKQIPIRVKIISKLYQLTNNSKTGFNHFTKYTGEGFQSKFANLVNPLIDQIVVQLQSRKQEDAIHEHDYEIVQEIDETEAKKIIQSFLNPPPKADPQMQERLADLIKVTLEEGGFMTDQWFGSWIKNRAMGFGIDKTVAESIITSLPTTEELLVIIVENLRDMWSIQTMEDGKKIQTIDITKIFDQGAQTTQAKTHEEIEQSLDAQFEQLAALSSDFASLMTLHTQGKLAKMGVDLYLTPKSLKAPIPKLYQKLFSTKEKNKQSFFPLIGQTIAALGEAAKKAPPLVLEGRFSYLKSNFVIK